jgi:exopolyphosphatase/guanosine-5'-triphosphate,3'-diphosphate pyrophosphatase
VIRASIDIGSNSTLLLIGNVDNGQVCEVLENESRVTGLGRDLDLNKKFIQIAMDESVEALKEYSELIKKHNVPSENIIVTATEATRVAKNKDEFINRVEKETGLKITVITTEAEAFYSTKGILVGAEGKTDLTIMDIGGASTEIISFSDNKIQKSFSMPVGAVRMTNWTQENTVVEYLKQIENDFSNDLKIDVKESTLYCVAGTMTSVGNMYLGCKSFKEDEVHGLKISVTDIKKLYQGTIDFEPNDYLRDYPFLGKRSKTIKAGLRLAIWVCDKLNIANVEISTYGLRYGTLLSMEIDDGFIFK